MSVIFNIDRTNKHISLSVLIAKKPLCELDSYKDLSCKAISRRNNFIKKAVLSR